MESADDGQRPTFQETHESELCEGGMESTSLGVIPTTSAGTRTGSKRWRMNGSGEGRTKEVGQEERKSSQSTSYSSPLNEYATHAKVFREQEGCLLCFIIHLYPRCRYAFPALFPSHRCFVTAAWKFIFALTSLTFTRRLRSFHQNTNMALGAE